MKDYSVLNGMIENQKSELRTAYDKGYNQCVKDFDLILATSKKEEEGYNRGVNDLWESVCKFMDADITSDKEIWGCTSWEKFAQLSPSEVIERLKEYNKKQEHIVRCCKNCKHSEKGMVGSTERCESCYYDGVSKANTLFEPMETDNSKIKVGDIVETRGFSKPVIVINTPFDFEDSDEIKVMNYLGDTAWVKIGNCSMTGRHIDKLAETFEQLKNE